MNYERSSLYENGQMIGVERGKDIDFGYSKDEFSYTTMISSSWFFDPQTGK